MDQLAALVTYLFVMAVTPGPNNIMLAVSGVNFGFKRTMPHLLGICFGNAVQMILCASLMFLAAPWIEGGRRWLALAGCVYLLWLAFKIARSDAASGKVVLKPLSFLEGALFQAINPKAWMLVLNTVILFMPAKGGWFPAVQLTLVGLAVGFPSIAVWAAGGAAMNRWMSNRIFLRTFNVTMALLLAATAIWLLVDELS